MAEPRPSRPSPSMGIPVGMHPGLAVLVEVTAVLSAGVFSESAMSSVVRLLHRSLSATAGRLWVRVPDGSGFRALAHTGDPPSREEADGVAEALRTGEFGDSGAWDQVLLRVPLEHEGRALGLLEMLIPRDGREVMASDVLAVVANVLSPLLASKELSSDLAGEVARRTQEMEQQRLFIAKVIDSLPVGLYVIDRDFRIQAWNRKRETGTHSVPREEAIGRPVVEVLHRQPRELLLKEFNEAFSTGRVQVYETVGEDERHYRITKVPMRLNDESVTHVITIGEDLTDWKNVQSQIAQSEKLAAIGQLAAGIMHEVNNPLATIGACVDAVAARAEDAPEGVAKGIAEYLGIMDSEVERCKRIVNNLLDLSRPRGGVKSRQDVNDVVEQTLLLLKHHERFKRLTIRRELADDLPAVMASGDHLIQVFMALMLNAADAMEALGTLTVRTGRNARRDDEVFIAFTDTGSGISKADIQKIFEPFYTTKPQGRGTGLGLSICYSIVAEHGGRIEVDSAIGRGSTFTVRLPIAQG